MPSTEVPGTDVTVGGTPLDLSRMRHERYTRLRSELERRGIDALVLFGTSAVAYATGAWAPVADAATAAHQRAVAVVLAGDDHPHLFTPFAGQAPGGLPADHIHPPVWVEDAGGVADFGRRLSDLFNRPPGRVGVDEFTGAMWAERNAVWGGAETVEAGPVLGRVRLCKTADEVECIRRAQQINELAMLDVEPLARPGVRQSELTGHFLRRVLELGATGWALDPIWQVMPGEGDPAPATTHGDLAFPLTSTDRVLRDGDVVWVDTGVVYEGYVSDFGRTWPVTLDGSPTPAQCADFRRWRAVIDAVLGITGPGVTGSELVAVARQAAGGSTPWPAHFYLAHGVGLDSAEAPLVGTDMGPAADEALVLAPGMVLVFEPEVFDPATGGYRAEEVVVITDDGHRMLSDHHYRPYA